MTTICATVYRFDVNTMNRPIGVSICTSTTMLFFLRFPRLICASAARFPADPTKAFYQFAAQKRFDKKVKGLSLGQGQGLKATRLIEEATQKGTWVSRTPCLRNAYFCL